MMRLTGERRALAAAVLAMYGFLYVLNAIMAPEGWGAALGSLAGIYWVGFVGVVAGYFWARWYVIGLGLSGFMTGVITMIQLGSMEPIFMFYAGTHGAVSLFMWGSGMAKHFDGRPEWRKRFHLDESGTNRLGKSVIRIGVSLPYVVLFALAPREGAALAALGGAGVLAGAYGIHKMRGWAVPVLGVSALTMLAGAVGQPMLVPLEEGVALSLHEVATAAIGFTMLAVAPFVRPVWNHLLSDD